MLRVHEFEAWSMPGRVLPMDYGKNLVCNYKLRGVLAKLGIPDDIVIGLSNIPNEVDVGNLQMDIKNGLFTIENFFAFCREYGLESNVNSKISACKYNEYSYGIPVAWIHIPEGREQDMLPPIVKLMTEEGLIVKEC